MTRLQRHFEADMQDIVSLENSKTSLATILALLIGILGTVFMAGSVFAVTAEPPIIWLCILLAIPAFAGWFCRILSIKKSKKKDEKDNSVYRGKIQMRSMRSVKKGILYHKTQELHRV